MINTLGGICSRIIDSEELISDLEDIMMEITAAKENIEKKKMKTS